MLTKLPGSKWWIETDDSGDIIGTYNKANITADIKSIKETLAQYPNPKDEETIVAKLIFDNKANSALIEEMYLAYQGQPQNLEIAQLKQKLESLITLRERLV